ncbi:MAG: UDP-N-acetylmuramoyl-tripeptide--D-alanyl-D-alanine ligase [Kiritimatiellae bacterium]|nr:UDP-N-acetylmuramoyl-tripeptide--D-alanyl-D-alanine ligase [Kiritimatiellia bacterium]
MSTFFPNDLERWSRGTWLQSPLDRIEGVCHDTRSITSGNLYVAIRGDRLDGHEFVEEAFRKGASCALVDRDFSSTSSLHVPLLTVDDTCEALTNLAQGYRSTWPGKIFGITGSVGKTTVKELVACVLAQKGKTTRTPGNWNNHIGVPLSLLSISPEDQFGVFEIGMSEPGELEPLCDLLEPSWGIITTIGLAHMVHFDSVKDVAKEKATLLNALPEGGRAVLSKDEPWYSFFQEMMPCPVITISLAGQADYSGKLLEGHRLEVTEVRTGDTFIYQMPLPGEYIMRDALIAIAVGREHDLGADSIGQGLKQYTPLSMRWNTTIIQGVQWINDAYNANPVSMRAALETFKDFHVEGNKWLVLGGMNELGALEKDAHIALGHEVAHGDWAGLITVGKLGSLIAQGAMGEKFELVQECLTPSEAGVVLKGLIRPGDAVLLKASRAEQLELVIGQEPGLPVANEM